MITILAAGIFALLWFKPDLEVRLAILAAIPTVSIFLPLVWARLRGEDGWVAVRDWCEYLAFLLQEIDRIAGLLLVEMAINYTKAREREEARRAARAKRPHWMRFGI